MPTKASEWRLSFFRKQLYVMTYRMFLKAREDLKQMSSDLYADLGMESEEEEDGKPMTHWPDFFDANEVAQVRKSDLKPKPKLNNFKSMESLLQEYNIRDQLDKKMSEYDSQGQHNEMNIDASQKARSSSVGANNQNESSQSGILSNSEYLQRESDIDVLSQHGISAQTFNLIQTKERLEDEARQRNMANLEKESDKRELQEHLRVAEALRLLFMDKNTRVIYLNEVIEQLQNRIHGQFIDASEMKRVIGSVSRILPHWSRIVAMPRGNVVRLEGKDRYQIGAIKKTITDHFQPVAKN